MSTAQEQAAAQSSSAPLTDAEKKRLSDLYSQIEEQSARANAANPEGRPRDNESQLNIQRRAAFEAQRAAETQRLQSLLTEFRQLESRASSQLKQDISEGGKRSQGQARLLAIKEFGGNLERQEFSPSPGDRAQQEELAKIAAYYPYATNTDVRNFYNNKIDEIELAQKDAVRAERFGDYVAPKPVRGFSRRSAIPANVEIDYAGTLAARMAGYNVGSGLTRNLPETFAKDEEKRFGERNKFIGLTEGKMPEPTPPPIQAPPITPQRQRAQTIQDSMDKTFAAPGFAQKGSDAYRGVKQQVHVLDSSLPVSRAELSVGAFDLEGQNATAAIFGIAPDKPKKLTEADVAKMSQAEIDAYNRQVETWNQYAGYVEKQSKAFVEAQRLVSLGSWKERKTELKDFIREAKKEGVKFVTINTKTGAITVPIERAAYEIIKADDVIGIGAVPNLPEGYTVAGSPQELVLLQEPKVIKQDIMGNITEQTGFGIPPQPSTIPGGGMNFLTLVGERAKEIVMDRSKSPAERGLAALGQVGVETFGGFVNLSLAAVKAYADLFNGTPANETKIIGGVEVELPETAPGAIVGGLSSSAYAAAVSRNPQMLLGGASEAYKQTLGLIKKQGLLATIAQTTGYVAPFSPSTIIKAIPLRYAKLVVPVARGIGKGLTGEIEPATIARQLKFGYGGQLGRAGVGYGDGSFFVGLPKPKKLPLARVVYTTERGGYRITEGPSGIFMTRPETLARLVQLKKLTEEEKAFTGIQKEATKEAGKIPDKILRTDLTPTGTEKPQSSLLAGKETAEIESLIVKEQSKRKFPVPALKGTLIEQYYAEVPFQRKDIDVDIGMMKKLPKGKGAAFTEQEQKALFRGTTTKEQIKRIKAEELFGEQLAEKIATGMQAVAGEGRLFKAEGRSVEVITGTGQKQKVFEAVTGKEALGYQQAFKTDPDMVFGEKVPKKVVQPGGKGRYKMLTYKFQGLRNVSALLELGGDLPKEGFLGVSKGREKEFFKRHEYLVTKAGQARTERQAIKLKEAAVITYEYAKKRGWWVERRGIDADEEMFSDVEPPNIVRSVGTAAKATTPVGAQAAKSVVISKPTTESDIESITGRKKQQDVIRSFSTGKEIKSTGKQFVTSASIGKSASVGTKEMVSKSTGGYKSISERPSASTPKVVKSRGSEAAKSFGSEPRPSPAGMIKPQPSPGFIPKPSPGSPAKPIIPDDVVPSPGTTFGKPVAQKTLPIKIPQLTQFETIKTKEPVEQLFPKVGTESRRGKTRKGKQNAFVGNVSDVDVALPGFNRKELITGEKTSAKRYKKDVLFAYKEKGFTKLVTQRRGSVLTEKKKGILFREEKKEVKRQKKKTGGFF